LRQARVLEHAAGLALVVGEREQEQLAGDELVAALGGFLVGQVERSLRSRETLISPPVPSTLGSRPIDA
jgi:hypothetical protein